MSAENGTFASGCRGDMRPHISEKINIYVVYWYCDDEVAKPGMALDC
ncbi:MAG: hypothetical protein KAU52_08430 [Methanosarcinales archaeon]|nr:hypothetical protein [Methanosarcinales archaeon]